MSSSTVRVSDDGGRYEVSGEGEVRVVIKRLKPPLEFINDPETIEARVTEPSKGKRDWGVGKRGYEIWKQDAHIQSVIKSDSPSTATSEKTRERERKQM